MHYMLLSRISTRYWCMQIALDTVDMPDTRMLHSKLHWTQSTCVTHACCIPNCTGHSRHAWHTHAAFQIALDTVDMPDTRMLHSKLHWTQSTCLTHACRIPNCASLVHRSFISCNHVYVFILASFNFGKSCMWAISSIFQVIMYFFISMWLRRHSSSPFPCIILIIL